jgi:hypothetical protein
VSTRCNGDTEQEGVNSVRKFKKGLNKKEKEKKERPLMEIYTMFRDRKS